jgi:hypothetical protein
VSILEGVLSAESIVVATPLQVSFATMKDGQSTTYSNHDAFGVDYRIDTVLKGPLTVGSTVRAKDILGECEGWEVTLQRTGATWTEADPLGERTFTPTTWMATHKPAPEVLFLTAGARNTPHTNLWVDDPLLDENPVEHVREWVRWVDRQGSPPNAQRLRKKASKTYGQPAPKGGTP